ncbi:MAG: hypothetical protein HQ458_03330 [Chloroflexi bacterium]|nr:hypothetical protein [Chloroflexota bacterium]
MARTAKPASTEQSTSRFSGIRNSLPAIFGAAALVAAGALAGTALANGGPDGRDDRDAGRGAEARMEMERGRSGAEAGPAGEGGSSGDRRGDRHRGPGGPRTGADLTGAVTSVSPTELSITLADGSSKTVVLDSESQYFTKTVGTAADVAVGSYVLVRAEKPADGAVSEADGIAVLESGLTDAHVHLGRPAKVTAVNGNTLTLEMTTRRGVKTIMVTIGADTVFSKIATATNADLTAGDSVVVDMGREAAAARSVLIVK